MLMLEKHLANLATILNQYNRLTRPMRRALHHWLREIPPFELIAADLPADFIDQYMEVANLAAFLDSQYNSPQLVLLDGVRH